MTARWTVLVADPGSMKTSRTFGDFEALTDAEYLATRINKRLNRHYVARAIPFYPKTQSVQAVVEALPARMLESTEGGQ